MARFAFGKGKKKTFWDIEQLGRILRTHESGGVSQYLPGFRRFPDERAARAELEQLVVERLAKGFVAVDAAAQELAAKLTKPASPTPTQPTLPIRCDLSVYNEANGFMVTSMAMAGVALDEGSSKWNKAVADAKMIPVILFQDDPFIVRVVAGDSLTPQETAEWVAKVEWPLNVPDGKLAVTGGAVLVNEEYDADDPYFESYLRIVDIPPGLYRATIYTYVPGVNGIPVLDWLAGGYRKSEPYGKWFRRTRPGETFPPWLYDWCLSDPSVDPDHKEEWKSAKRLEDSQMPEYITFLVHLEPSTAPLAPLQPPEEGWFGEAEGARRPEKSPLGLEAHDLIGREEEDTSGKWLYVHDVYEKTSRFPTTAIDDGPVELAPGEIGNLYRLAWFSHHFSVPEIRATLPEANSFSMPADWPAESLVLLQDRTLRIAFSNDVKPAALIPIVEQIGSHVAALPEGTELELACSQVDAEALRGAVPIALHRYRGLIQKGKWRIDEIFPRVSARTLRGALELSAEIALGNSIAVKDIVEGDAILKFANANHKIWIEDNPGEIADNLLTLGQREPAVLALYGTAAFAVRFSATWPVLDLSDDEEEEDENENTDLSTPVQGLKVLETPGGRMYFATMALMVSEKLAEKIQRDERALRGLGYKHVGDIVCNLFSKIAIRGYARDGGDSWACFLVAAPDKLVFEILTRFEKDEATLLTTRQPNAQDDTSKHSYRQSITTEDYAAMSAQHEARKAELATRYGPPLTIQRTHASFAEAIEAGLKKQLGG